MSFFPFSLTNLCAACAVGGGHSAWSHGFGMHACLSLDTLYMQACVLEPVFNLKIHQVLMCVYLYMCMCVHTCVHAFEPVVNVKIHQVWMCVNVNVRIYLCMSVCVYVSICIYICVYVYITYMYVYIYIQIYTCVYTYIYIYGHIIYIYIHIYIYVYI